MSSIENIDKLHELQNVIYSSRNPTRRWLHVTRKDRILAAFRELEGISNEAAIEVGPGSGLYIAPLCAQFSQVTAVDIERSHLVALQPLKKQFKNLEIIEQDITEQNWCQEYDLVLCSEVIEHVEDTSKFIASLGRVTKAGGVLILSTPQPLSFMELTSKIGLSPLFIGLVRSIYREPVLPTGHISLISETTLAKELHKNGFTIIKTSKFGLYIPVVAEFGGRSGVKLAKFFENTLLKIGVTWPLWTQLHICRKVS